MVLVPGGICGLREQVEQNPWWESDLLALYGFDLADVFAGRAPVRVALLLISRLPYEPDSLWRAHQLGGLEHKGWTPDTYRLAEIIDQVAVNTVAVGNMGSKKKPKLPEPSYRPRIVERDQPEAGSIEDFDINSLVGRMG